MLSKVRPLRLIGRNSRRSSLPVVTNIDPLRPFSLPPVDAQEPSPFRIIARSIIHFLSRHFGS